MDKTAINDMEVAGSLAEIVCDLDTKFVGYAFRLGSLNTAKTYKSGYADQDRRTPSGGEAAVASFNHALRVLPKEKAQQFINLIVDETPFEVRLRESEVDCEIPRRSQVVKVIASVTRLIECVDKSEADGDWSSEEDADYDARLIHLENEIRRARKARARRRGKRTA